jgi:hypothetical protein
LKPYISVILAGNRQEMWGKVYQSIQQSTKRDFELVIVSPHKNLPEELQSIDNIKHFFDKGSPSRAAQIACTLAEGKVLFVLMADDGILLPNALDVAVDKLSQVGESFKNVIVGRYLEGPNGNFKTRQPPHYYYLNYHDATRTNIPDNFLGLNNGVLYRQFFEYMGGYNCIDYEVCPLMLADFAIRAQAEGANFVLIDEILADYDWKPGATGDHNFIFDAQTQHDEPRYKEIYNNGIYNNKLEIVRNINSWKKSCPIWTRRWQ